MDSNINLISEDFAKAFISNKTPRSSNEIIIDDANFPSLGQQIKHSKSGTHNQIQMLSNSSKENVFFLQDFIRGKTGTSHEAKKEKRVISNKYTGNPLDSALPIRKSGKFREKPKRCSKLKCEIMLEKLEIQIQPHCEDEKNEVYVKDVCEANVILDDVVTCTFISRIVELQERLYKRDHIKGRSKRRFIMGFHEAKKYLSLNRVKIIIFAADLRVPKVNGVIQVVIEEIIELCKKNNVLYFFALKRRKLGTLTMKAIPVSCIAVMNYEGAEVQFSKIKDLLTPTEDIHLDTLKANEMQFQK